MDLLLQDQTAMSLDAPRIMGVLNLTPDSFSDGGQYADTGRAVEHGLTMAQQGADIIDVGGESSRPGAKRVEAEQQVQRVVPVIRALREKLDAQGGDTQISIDTTRLEVAEAAVEAGATILNDISAGREDPGMFGFAAKRDLPIVLMHMLGEPATMQDAPVYGDVVQEVRGFLLERAREAEAAGVDPKRIVLDPGVGFGKTVQQNLSLLRSIGEFVATGYPILVGASRKRFIEAVDPGSAVDQRLGGTCAVTTCCVNAGVGLLRVHDVGPNRQAIRVSMAIKNAVL